MKIANNYIAYVIFLYNVLNNLYFCKNSWTLVINCTYFTIEKFSPALGMPFPWKWFSSNVESPHHLTQLRRPSVKNLTKAYAIHYSNNLSSLTLVNSIVPKCLYLSPFFFLCSSSMQGYSSSLLLSLFRVMLKANVHCIVCIRTESIYLCTNVGIIYNTPVIKWYRSFNLTFLDNRKKILKNIRIKVFLYI